MLRIRFFTNADDPRPINWPIKHPYWITGEEATGEYSIIVSYADDEDYIMENWPEASDLDILEETDKYTFTSRFPIPDWFPEHLWIDHIADTKDG